MLFFLNPPTEQDNKDTKTLPKSEKKKTRKLFRREEKKRTVFSRRGYLHGLNLRWCQLQLPLHTVSV